MFCSFLFLFDISFYIFCELFLLFLLSLSFKIDFYLSLVYYFLFIFIISKKKYVFKFY